MATNKARPIPIGARNVSLDFSIASMRTTNTKSAVKNISIKSPCVIEVPPPKSELASEIGTGNMADTRPPAQSEATSCAGMNSAPRV